MRCGRRVKGASDGHTATLAFTAPSPNFASAQRSPSLRDHDMSTTLPILGAALTINSIPAHREWLLERQRDHEIQDFVYPEMLDGDWRATADRIKAMLDGHTGRRGIHGPFWGFKIDSQDPMIRGMVTKRLLQGLEIVEHLGATHMVVHSPYTTWD